MKPALQFAIGAGPIHILVGGVALCGAPVQHDDLYPENAGLREWNAGQLGRCGQCETVIAARIGHARATA